MYVKNMYFTFVHDFNDVGLCEFVKITLFVSVINTLTVELQLLKLTYHLEFHHTQNKEITLRILSAWIFHLHATSDGTCLCALNNFLLR